MQRILVFGAPGAGSSTLGAELGIHFKWSHLDLCDFFSIPAKEFYPRPNNDQEIESLLESLQQKPEWIFSGSVSSLDLEIESLLDGVIYLQLRRPARLQRLRERETARLGNEVTDPTHKGFKRFNQYMYWASQFDQAGMERESKILHESWLRNLSVPVMRMDASQSLEDCIIQARDWINPQD